MALLPRYENKTSAVKGQQIILHPAGHANKTIVPGLVLSMISHINITHVHPSNGRKNISVNNRVKA